MSFIEGRADDWIQTKLGETVHAQAVRTLFTDEDEIYQYQVRQLAPGRFDVEVVVKHGVDRRALSARLTRKFAGRLGAGTAVRVSFVDGVKRTPGGKVRVVSRTTT